MADALTVIGRATRVRGRITGDVDVEVQGFVAGEITLAADVLVESTGLIDGNVSGRRLVVRGAVKGDLLAEISVSLEPGARVVGDVRAPRIAIAPGAFLRGLVEVEGGEETTTAVRGQAAARPRTAPAASRVASPPRAQPRAEASATETAPARPAPPLRAPAPAAANNAARRPPPPVIPVLKKARGQIAKKRER